MALNSAAVFLPAGGHFYRAPEGTPAPSDILAAPAEPWDEIGHTSLEDILAWTSEGGEQTVLGTLQAPQLKVSRASRSETFSFNLQQWDAESLKLYFGQNMVDVNEDGSLLGVNATPAPTTSALLIVLKDSEQRALGIYAPKAELYRGDDVSIEGTDSISSLPIQVTPVAYSSNTWAFGIIPIQEAE